MNIRLAVACALCLSAPSAAQEPVKVTRAHVTEGTWEVTSTIRREGTIVRQQTYQRTVAAVKRGGEDAWLIVESSNPPNTGVDSVWVQRSTFQLLATHALNGGGEVQTKAADGRIVGRTRRPDGTVVNLDFVPDMPPMHFSAVPMILLNAELEPGRQYGIPILHEETASVTPLPVRLVRQDRDGIAEYEVSTPGGTLSLFLDTQRRTALRVTGQGPGGMAFETTFSAQR